MKTKYILFAFLSIIIVWFFFRFTYKINRNNIMEETKDLYYKSEVSYPENYDSLINIDISHKRNFLVNEAYTSSIVSNRFPYFRKKLNIADTRKIIELLNDSISYAWGEMGTPVYPKTIIYYNIDNKIIGFTDLEEHREVDSYPYRSLMKWGNMKVKAYKSLEEIIGVRK